MFSHAAGRDLTTRSVGEDYKEFVETFVVTEKMLRAQIRIGEVEAGLRNCRKAVRMQGNWAQLHYWLARTLREVKRDGEARRHFARAAQLAITRALAA